MIGQLWRANLLRLCAVKRSLVANMSDNKSLEELPKDPPKIAVEPVNILRRTHPPNKLERYLLVWTGRYKALTDVPKTVTVEVMEKTRSRARIKISNYMMVATVLACIGVAYSGKKAAERGESVQKMNLDWHKEINKGVQK